MVTKCNKMATKESPKIKSRQTFRQIYDFVKSRVLDGKLCISLTYFTSVSTECRCTPTFKYVPGHGAADSIIFTRTAITGWECCNIM